MGTTDLAGGSASGSRTAPGDSTTHQAPTTEATTFFSLPRELRDQIYSYIFKTVYTQISLDAYRRNLRLDRLEGGKILPARQLDIIRASRKLWEEGSRILYRENLFRLHVGSTLFNTTLLTRKTTDLMQRIEIDLYPSKELESVRAMQLFGGSRVLRKSCVIKLVHFYKDDRLHHNMVEAFKQMTGFEILIFEMDAPHGIPRWFPATKGFSPFQSWISVLFADITTNLTPTMGPSTCAKFPQRRLTFRPQDYRRQETGGH